MEKTTGSSSVNALVNSLLVSVRHSFLEREISYFDSNVRN